MAWHPDMRSRAAFPARAVTPAVRPTFAYTCDQRGCGGSGPARLSADQPAVATVLARRPPVA
eukprot:364425-Chlamydomonas_euryale.AAC.3